jgi:hypothetical protein
MPTAESLEIKHHVNVFLNITEILSLLVDQNASATVNAQETWLASTINARIHVLEHVDTKLYAQCSIIFQHVHVLKDRQVMRSSNVNLYRNIRRPLKKILAIHHLARLELFVGSLAVPRFANAFQDTQETLTNEDAIQNVPSIQTVPLDKHVPTTNAWILAWVKFVATTQNVLPSIMCHSVHVLKI